MWFTRLFVTFTCASSLPTNLPSALAHPPRTWIPCACAELMHVMQSQSERLRRVRALVKSRSAVAPHGARGDVAHSGSQRSQDRDCGLPRDAHECTRGMPERRCQHAPALAGAPSAVQFALDHDLSRRSAAERAI